MTAGQVANPFATPFKVPSIGTRTPSRSVRSKTMTETGHSISFLLSSLEVCYTPFMQFPSPSTPSLQNLLTWNLLPNGQFNTSSAYTLSQNSPITPPPHPTPPQPGNGFGKLLPFQESQPSFGWPVTKKFPHVRNIERLYCISLAIEYT